MVFCVRCSWDGLAGNHKRLFLQPPQSERSLPTQAQFSSSPHPHQGLGLECKEVEVEGQWQMSALLALTVKAEGPERGPQMSLAIERKVCGLLRGLTHCSSGSVWDLSRPTESDLLHWFSVKIRPWPTNPSSFMLFKCSYHSQPVPKKVYREICKL